MLPTASRSVCRSQHGHWQCAVSVENVVLLGCCVLIKPHGPRNGK